MIGAMRSGWWISALFAALVGCAPPEKDPGVAAYEALVVAVRRGDAAAVWTALTPESQAWLAARLALPPEASVEAVAAVLGVRPGWQFELDLPQKARAVAAQSGPESRLIEGPLAGQDWRIPTRRIDGVWRVDLAHAEPIEPSSP